jgi:hypothetical protein
MTDFTDISSKINGLFGYSPTQAELLQRPDLISIALDAIAANIMTLTEIATAINALMGTTYSNDELRQRPDLLRLGIMAIAADSGGAIADGSIITAKYADQSVTPAKLSQPLTLGSPVSPSAVSVVDYVIPSWVRIIICSLSGLSLSGTENLNFRLGSSGVPKATGYSGAASFAENGAVCKAANISTSFPILSANAANTTNGSILFSSIDTSTNTWAANGSFSSGAFPLAFSVSGSVSLDGSLNILRAFAPTNTFDAGKLNVICL